MQFLITSTIATSYKIKETWNIGIIIILVLIGEAFLGYVLIWSQIRFWACTVITSLLIVLPFIGLKVVYWIWRNYFVSLLTLKLFFLLHFILPLVLLLLIMIHLVFLHNYCSSSKVFFHGGLDKIIFFPYFWLKDFYNVIIIGIIIVWTFFYPYFFNDREIFLEINHLVRPAHIVPEWYFLFAYDILRSIPNKELGVILLLISIVIFMVFSFIHIYKNKISVLSRKLVWIFIFISFFLSWLGSCLVEHPFVFTGLFFSVLYFKFIFILVFW